MLSSKIVEKSRKLANTYENAQTFDKTNYKHITCNMKVIETSQKDHKILKIL